MTTSNKIFQCGRFAVDLSKPVIMGAINITPDSYTDGGRYFKHEDAIARALEMEREGAAIIDIGGESTRPYADVVRVEEELRRVIPVVNALSDKLSIPISVDTSRPEVMREAIANGASMINDVRSFRLPGAIDAVKNADVSLCVMHMLDEPKTMQVNPCYQNVLAETYQDLSRRVDELVAQGIAPARICIDPGFGFGKTVEHNLTLLKNVNHFSPINLPILIGVSRKNYIGEVLNKEPRERLFGTLASIGFAATKGAHIFRVHDVAPAYDVLTITHRIINQEA